MVIEDGTLECSYTRLVEIWRRRSRGKITEEKSGGKISYISIEFNDHHYAIKT